MTAIEDEIQRCAIGAGLPSPGGLSSRRIDFNPQKVNDIFGGQEARAAFSYPYGIRHGAIPSVLMRGHWAQRVTRLFDDSDHVGRLVGSQRLLGPSDVLPQDVNLAVAHDAVSDGST